MNKPVSSNYPTDDEHHLPDAGSYSSDRHHSSNADFSTSDERRLLSTNCHADNADNLTLMQKFVRWLDPKLEKYRVKPTPKPAPKPRPYTPQSTQDLIGVLRRTPESVLNDRQRDIIAAAMQFSEVRVREIMLPHSDITFVSQDDVLGPLVLDKLYQSGYSHFPVVDARRRVVGLLHTAALNSLQIRETDSARNFLDPHVYYLRSDYSLEQALAAFLRTNCYFFLVVDKTARLVGLLTYEMLAEYLLGGTITDNFDRDDDRSAVARRS